MSKLSYNTPFLCYDDKTDRERSQGRWLVTNFGLEDIERVKRYKTCIYVLKKQGVQVWIEREAYDVYDRLMPNDSSLWTNNQKDHRIVWDWIDDPKNKTMDFFNEDLNELLVI